MNCEVCGKPIPEERHAIIADAKMTVCEECAKFGKELPRPSATEPKKVRTPYSEAMPSGEEVLVKGWGERIRKARENAKLTQEELAKKISEKAGTIKHAESEKLKPEDGVIKKMEKALGITLKEKVAGTFVEKEVSTQALTLGDMIKIKKRKQ